MAKRKLDPDANEDEARVLRELAGKPDSTPSDIEAAWTDWSARMKAVETRTMTLLRAAFDAGVDAGRASAGKSHGRAGGLKGGKARARSLSKERRSEIAKKAARGRWGKSA
jgi:hypothetical protein